MSRLPRFQPGYRTFLARNVAGDTLGTARASQWKHPWFTTPSWDAKGAQWAATVEPGFVNALNSAGEGLLQTPSFRATVQEQQDVGNPWEINPLTGKPFFSDPIFSHEATAVKEKIVELPIYLEPAIPLSFYNVGFDGDPNFSVPQFFLNMGAAAAVVQPSALDQLTSGDVAPPVPPANLRLLRACDLWLRQPRAALTSSVTLSDGPAIGQSNVTQTLSILTPSAGDTLQILAGQFAPATPQIDPLSNDYTEPTFDQILVSTVYLLSPLKTPPGAAPDGTWQPFVKHNLFWNLNWAQPQFKTQVLNPDTPGLPVLAAGAGQAVINSLAATLNDATQNALNILLAHSLAGSFWTPTGGGSSSQSSVFSNQSPKSGPDRSANAQAKLAAARAVSLSNRLDPDFPYRAEPFPTAFLTP